MGQFERARSLASRGGRHGRLRRLVSHSAARDEIGAGTPCALALDLAAASGRRPGAPVLCPRATKTIAANPDGGWDAFSIWSVKAKFLAGGSGTWRRAMLPVAKGTLAGASHPGYPLLVPSAVASAWTVQGDTATETPAALSVLFAFATALLLGAATAWFRGETAGLIVFLLLLGSEGFVSQAGLQNADIPLSLYMLSTVILFVFASEHGWPRGTLLLAGLCCGLAAWTKNEGLPFCLVALAAMAWKGGTKALGWMALGTLPVAALLTAFKLLLVHDAEPVFPKTLGEALAKVADASRWLEVIQSFIKSLWEMGAPLAHPVFLIAILAAVLGLAPRARIRQQLWLGVPVAGVLAADFFAYLVSTADLSWHLSTSNLRLIVQVWPTLLFLAFLILAAPALVEAPSLETQRPAGVKAKRKSRKASRLVQTINQI